jgi:hypothetical protein
MIGILAITNDYVLHNIVFVVGHIKFKNHGELMYALADDMLTMSSMRSVDKRRERERHLWNKTDRGMHMNLVDSSLWKPNHRTKTRSEVEKREAASHVCV